MKLHWTDNARPATYLWGFIPMISVQEPYKWVGSHPETGEVLVTIVKGEMVYYAENIGRFLSITQFATLESAKVWCEDQCQ
jgi:hypothetical protein